MSKKVNESGITVMTPQFERIDGNSIHYRPTTKEEFDNLSSYSDDLLKTYGLGCWKKNPDGTSLWLLPYQWYDSVPEGYELTCINGKKEPFQKGVTDDDRRFGLLAYGILKPSSPE